MIQNGHSPDYPRWLDSFTASQKPGELDSRQWSSASQPSIPMKCPKESQFQKRFQKFTNLFFQQLFKGWFNLHFSGWWWLEHLDYFSIQLGMSSSQLTNSIIFQRGRSTTNQFCLFLDLPNRSTGPASFASSRTFRPCRSTWSRWAGQVAVHHYDHYGLH